MRVLIVEDEQPAARQLLKLIEAHRPGTRICDTLDSVSSTVRWLQHFPMPDLIFMDIQIADGISLDIFSRVEVTAPVIFTTAFDQYAVQAFKVNAIDYLLKPIDPEDFAKAWSRFEQRQLPTFNGLDLHSLLNPVQYKDRFLVKQGQAMKYLETKNIAFFRSADGLTQAHTFDSKKYFVDHSLDELGKMVNPREFFRISRSVNIALGAIQKIHPHLNGRLKVECQTSAPDDLFVSRDRVAAFKEWLGGPGLNF
jgi:DNA-binding LytR/AlgR family response regulator